MAETPEPGPAARRRLLTALLPFLSLLAVLLVLEALVRVFDVPPARLAPLERERFRLSENPILQWEHAPGQRDDHGVINERGLADDRVYELAKPDGVFRVAVLGDSVTAFRGGTGTNWTEILERGLNRELRGRPRVEVLNMAVGGYDSFQQAEYLRVRGTRRAPDLVLVGFCPNDHYYMRTGGQLARLLARRKSDDLAADGSPPSIARYLLRHSRLAFVLYYRARLLLTPEERLRARRPAPYGDELPSRLGLRLVQRLAEERGFDFRIVVFPNFESLGSAPREESLLLEIAAELGIRSKLIGLRQRFHAEPPGPREYAYDPVHLTAAGHAAVARFLLPEILALTEARSGRRDL